MLSFAVGNSFVNLSVLCGLCLSIALALSQSSSAQESAGTASYLGFDRNDYPGDANLKVLRQTFSFAGYWLNNPPGAQSNTWTGKRPVLESAGFGFLVLFNGRLYKELKRNAADLGGSDGQASAAYARVEGFPPRTIIFLDIEEGGRMLPEQKAYIYAWVDAVIVAGFRAGVYCSGIPAKEGKTKVVTAEDIQQNAGGRKIVYFVTNDVCPPSPGCAFPKRRQQPPESGISFSNVWQFAQSPKRKAFAAKCPANYNADGNCYPPGVDPAQKLHVDVETATSSDPSQGR
jgi:hypothetical protein